MANVKTLRIKWAGYCPVCDSNELDVTTTLGSSEFLYTGDVVVCSQCGSTGEIDCDDDHAFAVWDEE